MVKYLYILFLFGICSCVPSSVDEVIVENNVISCEVNEVPVEELLFVDKIAAFDSSLVSINRKSDRIFYVYNRADFSYQGSFGSLGQGPNDFLFPFFLNHNEEMAGCFTVYDVNTASFKKLEYESLMKGNQNAMSSVRMPSPLIGSPNLTQLTDGSFWGNIDSGQGLFFIYKEDTKELKWIDFPENLLQPKGDFTVMNMNRISVNENQGKVVSAMGYYNLLFLYDIEGNLSKKVQLGNEPIRPTIIGEHHISGDNLICCRDIESTNEAIYVLMQNVKEKNFENMDNPPSRIIVLDWNLNYLKTYQLPFYSMEFFVDEEYHRIIFTKLNEEGGTDICYIETK